MACGSRFESKSSSKAQAVGALWVYSSGLSCISVFVTDTVSFLGLLAAVKSKLLSASYSLRSSQPWVEPPHKYTVAKC